MGTRFPLSSLLTVGYIFALVGLNLITFLISDFYRRKFNQPAPRLGFLLAIIMGLLCAVLAFFQSLAPYAFEAAQSYLLLCAGVLTMYSTVSLHITMKRIRK